MSIEIATKVEAISEAAAEMDNLNNELADRKLQHAEQAQVRPLPNALRLTNSSTTLTFRVANA